MNVLLILLHDGQLFIKRQAYTLIAQELEKRFSIRLRLGWQTCSAVSQGIQKLQQKYASKQKGLLLVIMSSINMFLITWLGIINLPAPLSQNGGNSLWKEE